MSSQKVWTMLNSALSLKGINSIKEDKTVLYMTKVVYCNAVSNYISDHKGKGKYNETTHRSVKPSNTFS